MTRLRISASCRITAGEIKVNGQRVLHEPVSAFAEFIRLAYKNTGLSYPKFYKMDDLCKLGLVATEYLLAGRVLSEAHAGENIALAIQNASSTFDTDAAHQHSIDDRNNYFPSPAVFVYTLPNIMLGEICIRHKFFGENALLITPSFDAQALQDYVERLVAGGKASAVLCGWIEQRGDAYDALLMLTEVLAADDNATNFTAFTTEKIQHLYTL